jgi:photosystem II stability/assembly factor-like uncharacterized protein
MKVFFLLACLAVAGFSQANWVTQDSGTKVQFRGLSAVSSRVCWAAGSAGTYARTVDGIHWVSRQVAGAEKMVFRSVVAWDANHATLLSIGKGELSRIYHTDDGGANWSLQFTNPDAAAFYDAIQFWDQNHGIALSDPVDGTFRILRTDDGGKDWRVLPTAGMPGALTGEGAFAASGTCVVVNGRSDAWFATGGASYSRVFHSADKGVHWTVAQTPIPAGKETAGVFGLAFRTATEGIAVGGDYKSPAIGDASIAVTSDGGKSWTTVGTQGAGSADAHHFPDGLFEGAGFADATTVVVVGPDRAKHASGAKSFAPDSEGNLTFDWKSDIADTLVGLHACSFVPGTTDPLAQCGWAAGENGLIAKWIWAN